jgi:hypothetical protein
MDGLLANAHYARHTIARIRLTGVSLQRSALMQTLGAFSRAQP